MLRPEVIELREQNRGLLTKVQELECQNEAKSLTLNNGFGKLDVSAEKLPMVAVCLVSQEWARRSRKFDLVAPEGLRPKIDPKGNTWSVRPVPAGVDERTRAIAESFGYDPQNPPVFENMMLHCFPDKGRYEIAVSDLEKAQAASLAAQRQLEIANKSVQSALERGRKDLADQAGRERDHWETQRDEAFQRFMSCRAVIENAVERWYMIPMDAFERMWEYGMELKCFQCTVPVQKKHENLPTYEVKEPLVAPQVG